MADYILNDDRDAKDILIELRESTGMNRHQFCEYFEIPYMTVSDWEHGKKRVPKYFLRLLEYYVRMEKMNKEKGGQNIGSIRLDIIKIYDVGGTKNS